MVPQTRRVEGVRVTVARGLCRVCYFRAERDGTLFDHPRTTRPRADVVEDYLMLVETRQYSTRRDVAARLGMTVDALDRALYRAGVDVARVSR